eukprot:scaffold23_cov175-Amphora_coffeaeformis.AAC.18
MAKGLQQRRKKRKTKGDQPSERKPLFFVRSSRSSFSHHVRKVLICSPKCDQKVSVTATAFSHFGRTPKTYLLR